MKLGNRPSCAGVNRFGRLSSTPSAQIPQISRTFQLAKYSMPTTSRTVQPSYRSPAPRLVGFAARCFLVPFSGRLAGRRRIRLGQYRADRAAQHADADALCDVDLDLLRAQHLVDGADDTAAGDYPVAAPERAEHRAVILRF